MTWLLGPFLSAFVVAFLIVRILQAAWADVNAAVQSTTFIGTFASVFSAGEMKNSKKSARKWRPRFLSLGKNVDSLRKRK